LDEQLVRGPVAAAETSPPESLVITSRDGRPISNGLRLKGVGSAMGASGIAAVAFFVLGLFADLLA
jgi:hypothetical protein